jgi:hypothetical protein
MTAGVPSWTGGTPPPTFPDAPTITGVVSGDAQATVSFTAPSSNGGSAITSYTAISEPDDFTGTLSQAGGGSITVEGLTNGTAYTFEVTATNAVGTGTTSGASSSVTPVLPPPEVGDLRYGGVVFWVDPTDNTHGLVCALQDYNGIALWCDSSDLPSVPNVAYYNGTNPVGNGAEIGDGESNTNGILADCPTAPAAIAARSYGAEWFLPSIEELQEMYLNRASLEAASGFNAFLPNYYWSSTEINSSKAWYQYFFNGSQASYFKYGAINVRAVRAF